MCGERASFWRECIRCAVFSNVFVLSFCLKGGRVLGPRYGDDEARKLAIEATARGLDVAGFHTQTSGRYEPLYPVPPSGGLLSREQYQAAFHQAHQPLPPSLERDMLEIHQGAVPVGGDRWAYNQRVGLGNVPRERDMVISHLAW